jgi:DNA-binding HxlR family transcriptional regulator
VYLHFASTLITVNSMGAIPNTKRRSECPISFGLDLFGDKWTLLILRDMLLFDRTHFSTLVPHEHIASNILSDRLLRLEAAKIIHKKRTKNIANQSVYELTENADSLLPILLEFMVWGFMHDDKTPVNKSFRERVLTEKDVVLKEIIAAVNAGAFVDYRIKHMGVPADV